ncbi:MAG: DUF86 domain-containing protein [Parabacteroides sp.]|nr:DUF86 domain-containing protein [Parabacteroides sp.]
MFDKNLVLHTLGLIDRSLSIIVHHYFDVDADEIFNICKNDIPVLHEVIKRMIADQK